jgi:antitoxin YefM
MAKIDILCFWPLQKTGGLGSGSTLMSHISYTDLRNSLAKYMDEVCDSHAPLHVTRRNARTVVMLSEDDFEGLMETVHLLKSPANAGRLLRSMVELDRANERELIEPGSF